MPREVKTVVNVITHHILRNVIQYQNHFVHTRTLHWNAPGRDPNAGGQINNTADAYKETFARDSEVDTVVDLTWNPDTGRWQLPQDFIPSDFVIYNDDPDNNLHAVNAINVETPVVHTDARPDIPEDLVTQLRASSVSQE